MSSVKGRSAGACVVRAGIMPEIALQSAVAASGIISRDIDSPRLVGDFRAQRGIIGAHHRHLPPSAQMSLRRRGKMRHNKGKTSGAAT